MTDREGSRRRFERDVALSHNVPKARKSAEALQANAHHFNQDRVVIGPTVTSQHALISLFSDPVAVTTNHLRRSCALLIFAVRLLCVAVAAGDVLVGNLTVCLILQRQK